MNKSWFCFIREVSSIFYLLTALSLAGCAGKPQDPFTLTAKDAGKAKVPADVGYIDDGYAWGFIETGFMLNGHGLPDHWRAMVVTHNKADGKAEIVWPVFAYGNDQANAEVSDHVLVFAAGLPDGTPVLMAHRVGEPPMVITEAVLRLAAKRLGTNVVVPRTDYSFTKVRQPPGRIWLEGQPSYSLNTFPPAGVFSIELSPGDLQQVMDDTRQRAKAMKAGLFDYLSEPDPVRLSLQDVAELGKVMPVELQPANKVVAHQGLGYQPRNENLGGSVLIDVDNQMGFFISRHEPGRILKVALGAGPQAVPKVIGVTTLEPEENDPFNAWIDAQHGYGYFGTDFPGHLVKLGLGGSNEPARRISSALVDRDENVGQGLLDAAGGYGYFQIGNRLVKIRLGKGDAPPVVVSALAIPEKDGRRSWGPGVLDPVNHCAYFGTDWRNIYQISLGEGDRPPRILNTLTIDGEVHPDRGAFIDTTNRYAWFVSSFGFIYKVSLGGSNGPMRYLGKLYLGRRYQYLNCVFGRDDAGYAYLGTGGGGRADDPECCTAGVMKVALGAGDSLPRMVSFTPVSDDVELYNGAVDSLNRMLYASGTVAGAGSIILKFKLGAGDTPPELTAEAKLYLK